MIAKACDSQSSQLFPLLRYVGAIISTVFPRIRITRTVKLIDRARTIRGDTVCCYKRVCSIFNTRELFEDIQYVISAFAPYLMHVLNLFEEIQYVISVFAPYLIHVNYSRRYSML